MGSRAAAVEEERSVRLRNLHHEWLPERLVAARTSLGWSRATLARKITTIEPASVDFTPPAAAGQMITP
jgi:ribosome-binding protein aMBF1 (putative translation factor)